MNHSLSLVRGTRRRNSGPLGITDSNMRSSENKFGEISGNIVGLRLYSSETASCRLKHHRWLANDFDFCNLNAETNADSHPLPLIEEEITKRAKGHLFSVLRHGFHEMPLRKDSQPVTCMCTPCGPVQWTVMPMGLENAPSFFQRMMGDVLFTAHLELCAFVSVHIDDIFLATEGEGLTKQELMALHEEQLNQVMDILDANQLICGPKKGNCFLKSVEFCGSLLKNGTRRPSPGKLVAIQKWKRPETFTEMRHRHRNNADTHHRQRTCACHHTRPQPPQQPTPPPFLCLTGSRRSGIRGPRTRGSRQGKMPKHTQERE